MMKIQIAFILVVILFFIFLPINSYSQRVGINTTGALPNASALLDVDAAPTNDKGILIPRVSLTNANVYAPITGAPVTSLLVYNTNAAMTGGALGYWYWDGAQWVQLGTASSGNAWLITGNTGITAANFLGTINNAALNFKVNFTNSGIIDPGGATFLGYQAGNTNANPTNTGFGYQALFSNTSGDANTACGWGALGSNTIGYKNTATGLNALTGNSNGIYNSAHGAYSLRANVSGSYNTASGYQSLFNNNTGYSNVAMGVNSLYNNTGRSNLVAVGDSALYNNGLGVVSVGNAIANTAVGSKALYSNTDGAYHTALGYQALYFNTTGRFNTATGASALYSNNTGNQNTANGIQALYSNTTGSSNTATGENAMYFNQTGIENTATGASSLYRNTGNENTAHGYGALTNNTSGFQNTAVGHRALNDNNLGNYNTATGWHALYTNNGSNNTAIGYVALNSNTAGGDNTAIGRNALFSNTLGNSNTACGMGALANNTTGGNNTALGYLAFNTGTAYSNSTALGYNAQVTASNNMVFGDGNVVGWGFGVAPGGTAIRVGTGATNGNGANLTVGGVWTNGSSITFKDDITPLDGKDILDKIMKLDVARWRYIGTNEYHIGPFAEQFYELFNTGVDSRYISTVDPSGVALAAIKAQQQIINNQKLEIINLKSMVGNLSEGLRMGQSENENLKMKISTLKSEYDSRLKKLEEIFGEKAEK